MRYLILLALILAPLAGAVDYEFVGGSADKFVIFKMIDSTDGTAKTGLAFGDMSASYVRNNAAADVHDTVAEMATMGTHEEWGWHEVDSTNSPGEYQFGIPDAAIADGAESVDLILRASGAFNARIVCHLIDVDFRSGANVDADLLAIAGTAQDATDLGDFASDGYNPSTDKLKGLELADTATTVTNQVTAAANRAEMDSNSTQLAAIVADTNELQVDDIPTLIAALPTAVENRTEIDSNSTQLAAIVADTAELQTDDIPTLIAALPTAVENRTEMDSNSTQLAAIVGDTAELQTDDIPTLVAALPTAAEVNTQVDTALADIHLDHLLATTYDPASKPGTADALLNELVESDSGVSRFTENSLEQAPSGTGGDASAANQAIITTHLTELKGSGFVGSTDSNEAIRNRGDAAWGPPSDGDTLVNQDTGGTNAMQVLDTAGNPVAGAYIRCYRKVDYDADDLTTLRGSDTTNDNGAWHAYLSTGVAYTITADYEGRTDVLEVTP